MKRYEYERVVYEGVMVAKLIDEHRVVIDRRAADGWRYAGYIPVYESARGVIQAIDLIFEKDAEEE